MKIDNKKIIKLYYTALMTFLVFTFANDLLRSVIVDGSIEHVLYLIFWIALVIQTTYAYRHIMNIKRKKYTALILVSDCIDVVVEIFVCAVINTAYKLNGYHEWVDYRLLSIPFMVLAINQICWYIGVGEKNPRAIIRLIILFVGMLTVTIFESIDHNIYNLAIFVIVHALSMAILRAFDETRQNGQPYIIFIEKKKKDEKDDAENKDNNPNPNDKK